MTSDLNSRWTKPDVAVSLGDGTSRLDGWMPEPGGILYSADMTIFYQTFFKNPNADWKYILGFEPTFMPAEDFDIYHKMNGISATPKPTRRGWKK